jgi:RimJ/RimL family protein N-acetyltransferase
LFDTLDTERLLLRPPGRRDLPAIVPLANDYDVAKNLASMPHPFDNAACEQFLNSTEEKRAACAAFTFAITRKSDGAVMGCIGLHREEGAIALGYWLGKIYWKQGYATEAARRMLRHAFEDLDAPAVEAGWFHDNPRSGHVLAKLGCVPDRFVPHRCVARGVDIGCNFVRLSREAYLGRRAA